jgi:hypothetical protein
MSTYNSLAGESSKPTTTTGVVGGCGSRAKNGITSLNLFPKVAHREMTASDRRQATISTWIYILGVIGVITAYVSFIFMNPPQIPETDDKIGVSQFLEWHNDPKKAQLQCPCSTNGVINLNRIRGALPNVTGIHSYALARSLV